MRYMLIMQVSPEAAATAAEELDMNEIIALMGAYNEEMMKAGVLLTGEGLTDASEGFRVDFSSTPPAVTDGPYAEAREVFSGFWMLEVTSREEAQHWALKAPLSPGTALEVRRVTEMDDFQGADETAQEWLDKEEGWRKEQEFRASQG